MLCNVKAHNDYSAMHVSAMVELCSVVCVERLMVPICHPSLLLTMLTMLTAYGVVVS